MVYVVAHFDKRLQNLEQNTFKTPGGLKLVFHKLRLWFKYKRLPKLSNAPSQGNKSIGFTVMNVIMCKDKKDEYIYKKKNSLVTKADRYLTVIDILTIAATVIMNHINSCQAIDKKKL